MLEAASLVGGCFENMGLHTKGASGLRRSSAGTLALTSTVALLLWCCAGERVCWSHADCVSGFVCDSKGACVSEAATGPTPCAEPSDCRANESCGTEGACVAGDCSRSGCVDGWYCALELGAWTCVAADAGGAGFDAGGAGAGGEGTTS